MPTKDLILLIFILFLVSLFAFPVIINLYQKKLIAEGKKEKKSWILTLGGGFLSSMTFLLVLAALLGVFETKDVTGGSAENPRAKFTTGSTSRRADSLTQDIKSANCGTLNISDCKTIKKWWSDEVMKPINTMGRGRLSVSLAIDRKHIYEKDKKEIFETFKQKCIAKEWIAKKCKKNLFYFMDLYAENIKKKEEIQKNKKEELREKKRQKEKELGY